MTTYDFIFSNKPAIWFYRHEAFWIVFTLYFFIKALLVPGVNEAHTSHTPFESLINISYFLPVYTVSLLNVQLNMNSTDNTFLSYRETGLQKQPMTNAEEKIVNIPAENFLNTNIQF